MRVGVIAIAAALALGGCQQLGIGQPKRGSDKWCESFLKKPPATITTEDILTFAEDCEDAQIKLGEQAVRAGIKIAEEVAPEVSKRAEKLYEEAEPRIERAWEKVREEAEEVEERGGRR